jgi:hypothetical protein
LFHKWVAIFVAGEGRATQNALHYWLHGPYGVWRCATQRIIEHSTCSMLVNKNPRCAKWIFFAVSNRASCGVGQLYRLFNGFFPPRVPLVQKLFQIRGIEWLDQMPIETRFL